MGKAKNMKNRHIYSANDAKNHGDSKNYGFGGRFQNYSGSKIITKSYLDFIAISSYDDFGPILGPREGSKNEFFRKCPKIGELGPNTPSM